MFDSKHLFKLLLILALVGISTSSFSQTENLKVLFNPLEDYVQDAKGHVYHERQRTNEERLLSDLLQTQLEKQIRTQKQMQRNTLYCMNGYEGVNIDSTHLGSFTRKSAKEKAVVYSYCEGWESFGNLEDFQHGLAILEGKTLVANFIDFGELSLLTSATYSVTDINQNDLNELMMVVPSSITKGSDIQLLEFGKTIPVSLGTIEIGGPGFTPTPISRVCNNNDEVHPESLPNNFLSNVIYVKKARKPIFYRQTHDVTVTCINLGVYPLQARVNWKKVGGITEVKLQPKAVLFVKIFSR